MPADRTASSPTIIDFERYMDSERVSELNPKFRDFRLFNTRYFSYLTLLANYRVGGLDVFGYHAVNLLLHILNSLLVYALVLITMKTPAMEGSGISGRAGMAALLCAVTFAVHPAMTEGVTYISQRSGLLATMFYLGSLTSFAKARLTPAEASGRGRLYYIASMVAAVCAMKSKEIAITLPVAALMYESIFMSTPLRKRILMLAPHFLTALIIPFAYLTEYLAKSGGFWAAIESSTRHYNPTLSRADYLFTQLRVIPKYILLMLWPSGQSIDHDVPVSYSLLEPAVLLSLFLIVAVVAIALYLLWRARRRSELRLISFGILWFFLALSVESSVLPTYEMMVEYRLYLPGVGAALCIVTAVFVAYDIASDSRRRLAIASLALTALLALGVTAYLRNGVWESAISIWDDAVRKGPDKMRPLHNLATQYLKKDDLENAERYFIEATKARSVQATSTLLMPHLSLAGIYASRGDYDKAIEHYDRALEAAPGDMDSLITALMASIRMGRPVEPYVELAARTMPNPLKALTALAVYMRDNGDPYMARTLLEAIIRRPWDDKKELAEAHYQLGLTYQEHGKVEEAYGQYVTASGLDSAHFKSLVNQGAILIAGGKHKDAADVLRAALEISPEYFAANYNMGIAMKLLGRREDALRYLNAALKARPDDPGAMANIRSLLDQDHGNAK